MIRVNSIKTNNSRSLVFNVSSGKLMSLSQVFRKNTFWFFDTLKGSPVKKNYEDIKDLIENDASDVSKNKKEKYLKQLLEHATSTTRFYEKYLDCTTIFDFPIINKNLIRDNFSEFASSAYEAKKCTVVSTSGSTGAPFSVLHDPNKRVRNKADSLYFSKRAGYEIGQQLVYVKIWPEDYKQSMFSKSWFQNIYPQSVFKLNDNDIVDLINHLTTGTDKKSFLGYPSAFEKICKYLDKINSEPIQCNTTSIIAMSEVLNEYTYDSMLKYFGVAPVSRYSNNENGILGQQDFTDTGKFVINTASYYFEIFDINKDIPVENGKQGRIIVTDLHNYASPIIRYDTGDIGVMEQDENKVPFLVSVAGRKMDLIYDTIGNIVPSHVSVKLCKYGEYKQYQLIQEGEKEYLIKLNTDKKIDEEKVLEEFKGFFGLDASITIEYVDEIPLLSSGKRREVSNTYHPQLYTKSIAPFSGDQDQVKKNQ